MVIVEWFLAQPNLSWQGPSMEPGNIRKCLRPKIIIKKNNVCLIISVSWFCWFLSKWIFFVAINICIMEYPVSVYIVMPWQSLTSIFDMQQCVKLALFNKSRKLLSLYSFFYGSLYLKHACKKFTEKQWLKPYHCERGKLLLSQKIL